MIQVRYEKTEVGTPKGGNLSPLLSNIMLNELDKELEGRGLNFVRYADDSLIMVRSEKAANRIMKSIKTFIEKKLGLKVNAEKSKVVKPTDVKYLCYGFYYDCKVSKYKPKPHLKSIEKLRRKLKQLTKRSWSISLEKRIQKLRRLIIGWVNYFKIANMKSVMMKLDAKIRARIRIVMWKQWKVSKKRIESLMELGIDREEAKGITYCRKGYQFIGHSKVIQKALSNEILKNKGLPSLTDQYLKVHTVI